MVWVLPVFTAQSKKKNHLDPKDNFINVNSSQYTGTGKHNTCNFPYSLFYEIPGMGKTETEINSPWTSNLHFRTQN